MVPLKLTDIKLNNNSIEYSDKILLHVCYWLSTCFSISVAALLCLWVRVYTRPVVVRGSTIVSTSASAILMTFGDGGYLNDRAGPWGWSKLSLTSLLSLSFVKTWANHQWPWLLQVTYHATCSSSKSVASVVTLSTFERFDNGAVW